MTREEREKQREHLSESVRWYRKAAGMGSDVAQYELGVMHLPMTMHEGSRSSEIG